MSVRFLILSCGAAWAAVPPAERLLPPDTVAFVTLPGVGAAREAWLKTSVHALWTDASLAETRNLVLARLDEWAGNEVTSQTGLDIWEVLRRAEGQITIGLLGRDWGGPRSEQKPEWVFVLDAGGNASELRTLLSEATNRLAKAGVSFEVRKIRDRDILSVPEAINGRGSRSAQGTDVSADGKEDDETTGPNAKVAGRRGRIWFGMSESLLLVANGHRPLEEILARQIPGTNSVLADTPEFRGQSAPGRLEGSQVQAWVHSQSLALTYLQHAARGPKSSGSGSLLIPSPARAIKASGLAGVRTAAMDIRAGGMGIVARLTLSVPEVDRKGLFKSLALTTNSAAPPLFVPANATRFQRWRLDGQKAWASLEQALSELSPPLSGILDMSIGALGKDKEAGFDFRKSFIEALGDDLIYFETPTMSAGGTNTGPERLLLVGTTRADGFQQGVVAAASLLPSADAAEHIRETLIDGRKIRSLPLDALGSDEAGLELHFGAFDRFVAFSTSLPALTRLISGRGATNEPLVTWAPLALAAVAVGGFEGGIFAYENHRAMLSSLVVSTNALAVEDLMKAIPGGMLARLSRLLGLDSKLSLLALSRHVPLTVSIARLSPDGFTFIFHAPNPDHSPAK